MCGNLWKPEFWVRHVFWKENVFINIIKALIKYGKLALQKKKKKNGEAAIFWNKKLASVKCIPYLNEFKKTIVIKNWNVCYASVFKVYGEAMPMILCTILYIPEHYYIYRY